MLIKTDQSMKPGAKQVVFFFGPYGVPMSKLWLPLRSLRRAGYSVITYEYPKAIFRTGDPKQLLIAIDETRQHVRSAIDDLKKQGYTDFGFFGSSLGAFIVYNCFKATPEFGRGVLNGGGDAAEAVWSFQSERRHFEATGYTLPKLRKVWHNVQYLDLGDLTGKNFILISSHGDTTTTVENALKTRDQILNAGPNAEIIMHKRLNHVPTVAVNLLRVRKHVRKVHAKSMLR